jgi:hypothetical protein
MTSTSTIKVGGETVNIYPLQPHQKKQAYEAAVYYITKGDNWGKSKTMCAALKKAAFFNMVDGIELSLLEILYNFTELRNFEPETKYANGVWFPYEAIDKRLNILNECAKLV